MCTVCHWNLRLPSVITNNSEYYVSFVKTGSRESHQFQPLVAAAARSTFKGISIVASVILIKQCYQKIKEELLNSY